MQRDPDGHRSTGAEIRPAGSSAGLPVRPGQLQPDPDGRPAALEQLRRDPDGHRSPGGDQAGGRDEWQIEQIIILLNSFEQIEQ